MKGDRQLGLLWGGVALLLLAAAPVAGRLAAALPACPVRLLTDLPCPSCGTTRAAMALARLDPLAALAVNPLAAVAWLVLVGGGLLAGAMAVFDRPMREPNWRLSVSVRWLLGTALLVNWIYLVGAGV